MRKKRKNQSNIFQKTLSELTLQAIQCDCADSNTDHGFGIVIELTADGEERKRISRLCLLNKKEKTKQKTNIIVEELDSVCC